MPVTEQRLMFLRQIASVGGKARGPAKRRGEQGHYRKLQMLSAQKRRENRKNLTPP